VLSLGLEDIYLLTTTAGDSFSRREFRVMYSASVPSQVQNSTEFRLVSRVGDRDVSASRG